jgi:hypothetical protein
MQGRRPQQIKGKRREKEPSHTVRFISHNGGVVAYDRERLTF